MRSSRILRAAPPAAILCATLLCGALARPIPAFGGDGRELVIVVGTRDIGLNPYRSIYAHEMQVYTGLYEGLFSYDPQTLDPVRAVASSYEHSDDGKTWTFTLRDEARWSDGTRVTAGDFVESWLYLLDPATEAEYAVFLDIVKGAKAYRSGLAGADAVGISAPDDRTLVIELVAPAAYLTRLLCHSAFVPVHRSLRRKPDWKADELVVNGPYAISSLDAGSMLLSKNPLYWDAASVAAESVRIRFLDSEDEATRLYNEGSVHWLTDLADTDALAAPDDIRYAPMFGTGYYFWNTASKPWNDARVRRALSLLIPWESIRTKERYYAPTSVLVLPFAGYGSPKGIEARDEKAAMRLLSQAGFPGGKGLPPVRFVSYESATHEENLAIIEEAWSRVGVRVERIIVPPEASLRDSRGSDFDLSFTSWIGDFADPAAFLLMWTSDSGLNEASYRSRSYDELLSRSMREEGSARLATLAKAEAKLLGDAALMPLYHSLSFNVIDTEAVTGWYQNPLDIHPLKALGFGQAKARPFVASAIGVSR